MKDLKQLFSLKNDNSDSALKEPQNNGQASFSKVKKQSTTTYKQHGMMVAGACNGDVATLEPQLSKVKKEIEQQQAENGDLQRAHKEKVNGEITRCELELRQQDEVLRGIKDAIAEHESKIKEIDREIANVKAKPEELDFDPMSQVGFYIGGTILVFLTIYLFVFYSSAVYSAFFKVFTPDDTGVSQAIFDAQAIAHAWNMGVTALLFILLIPFVFLGLGFLIHKFQERDKEGHIAWTAYAKSFALIVVTFIFDAILAYEITEKLYELKRAGSFETMPEYNLSMAIGSVAFWVIIFSGFLVYLIWGLVFDFTMASYQGMNKVAVKVNALRSTQRIHRQEIDMERSKLSEIEGNKRNIELQLTDWRNKLGTVVFDKINLALEIANFFSGWLIYVSNHDGIDTREHVEIYNRFCETHQIQAGAINQ